MEFICTQPPTILAAVLANVLDELRPKITEAWVDAFTDGAWRLEQGADLEALLAVEHRLVRAGARCIATGMGIDLDISRDDEFGLLVRLAPHSINSEALAGSCRVFSSSDTGDHRPLVRGGAELPGVRARAPSRGMQVQPFAK